LSACAIFSFSRSPCHLISDTRKLALKHSVQTLVQSYLL